MALRIGIEACGKSFTVIAMADEGGTIVAAKRFPYRLNYNEMHNPSIGADVYRLIWHVVQESGLTVDGFCEDGGRICAGITGVSTKYDRRRGCEEIWRAAELPEEGALLTGGIEIAFTGATRNLRGAAVSCHAGSVAMARTDKSIKRAGGWGSLLGDEGSAYWMGIRALNALCRLRDGRLKEETTLGENIRLELQSFPAWSDILTKHSQVSAEWVDALILLAQYTRESKEFRYIVSDLAKAVFKTLDQNPEDAVARRIVDASIAELLDQIEGALNRAQITPADSNSENIPLVLMGGIFRYQKRFVDLFKEETLRRWPEWSFQIIVPSDEGVMRPAIGALLFALSGSLFQLPSAEVIKRVEQTAQNFEALVND